METHAAVFVAIYANDVDAPFAMYHESIIFLGHEHQLCLVFLSVSMCLQHFLFLSTMEPVAQNFHVFVNYCHVWNRTIKKLYSEIMKTSCILLAYILYRNTQHYEEISTMTEYQLHG
jgi:hypothetical protein